MYTLTCIPVMVTFDVVKNPSTENTAGQTCQFPKGAAAIETPRGDHRKAYSTTYIYSALLCCRHLLYLHSRLC